MEVAPIIIKDGGTVTLRGNTELLLTQIQGYLFDLSLGDSSKEIDITVSGYYISP